jgi:hypothetical protein
MQAAAVLVLQQMEHFRIQMQMDTEQAAAVFLGQTILQVCQEQEQVHIFIHIL